MDFIDELRQFSKRIETMKDKILTEEATKTSLIMPFFQILGYDIFNPHEFLPEFTADVGIKKGEKVDYAIMKNDKPIILIEAKWCNDQLDKHDSQLFRYFGTTSAKFAILTNGIVYKFYTDLDEANKMDSKPFLEIDLLDIKENYIAELKKFTKDSFDMETIFNSASELKYTNEIIKHFTQQIKHPSDNFIKYILSETYSGIKTQNVIDKFRDVVKKAFNQFISELMNDKITTALKSNEESDVETVPEVTETNTTTINKIITTEEELEGYFIVKQILSELVPYEKITYKDTESYFGILYENNTRKWICRLRLDGSKKMLFIPADNQEVKKHPLNGVYDLYNHKEDLLEVLLKYIN